MSDDATAVNVHGVEVDYTEVFARFANAQPGRFFHALDTEEQRRALDDTLALVAFCAGELTEDDPTLPPVVARMSANFARLLGDLVGFRAFLETMRTHEDRVEARRLP